LSFLDRESELVGVDVRAASAEELPSLERELPMATPSRHRDCLAQQADGVVTYLVAWHRASPVGHGLIHWPGPRETALAERLPGCPEIYNLGVREDLRSRGIGTRLLRELERLALERGRPRVGLGVALANARARALYERLGYRAAGLPAYVDRWRWADPSGVLRIREDPTLFLIKDLTAD
jgi:ribosomal protein S18 acetylase RimI-like enzyme